LYYEVNDKDLAHLTEEREGNGFLINLIDSPERIDFFNGVATAVRISDGALFLVNCVTG
jgi:elongation factor 2